MQLSGTIPSASKGISEVTNLIKRKRSLNLTIILQIGIQIIKRIETVHGKYLLHRDIKPENIFLTCSGTFFGAHNKEYLLNKKLIYTNQYIYAHDILS